jgi:PAS domain S-box-containing protein
MKWQHGPARFSQRILLGFSILILLFLGGMVAVELVGIPGTANKGSFERYRSRILSDMELVSGLLAQRMTSWQRERRVDIDGLASSPLFRQALAAETVATAASAATPVRELAAFRASHPDIDAVALLDATDATVWAAAGGFIAAASARDLGIDGEGFAKLVLPGYQEAVALSQAADRKPRLRIIRQVFSATMPDQVVAVLVAECDIERALHLRIWSASNLLARDWQCVMAGKSGEIVTQFRETRPEEAPAGGAGVDLTKFTPVHLALSGIEGPYDGPDQRGRPVLAFYRQIRFDQGIALALVLQMDRALALHPAAQELWHRCILWLCLLVAGIGLCLFLSHQLSRPINELVAVARRIEAGDLTGRVATPDASEIGRFAAVFNGMVARLQTSHQDLEQQVLARTRDLHRLMARQEAILTAAPDIIVEVDSNRVYTWSNRAGFEFFGDGLIGQPVAAYVVGEPITSPLFQQAPEAAKKARYVESWQRRQDGEFRLLAWWSSELKDDQGRVSSVISTARDITERMQAEEALKQEYEELERFNRVTLNRELRMIELKKEINALLRAAGHEEKYRIVSDEA